MIIQNIDKINKLVIEHIEEVFRSFRSVVYKVLEVELL